MLIRQCGIPRRRETDRPDGRAMLDDVSSVDIRHGWYPFCRLLPLIFLPKTACLFLLLFCTSNGFDLAFAKASNLLFLPKPFAFPEDDFFRFLPPMTVYCDVRTAVSRSKLMTTRSTVCSFCSRQTTIRNNTYYTFFFCCARWMEEKREGRKKSDNYFTC